MTARILTIRWYLIAPILMIAGMTWLARQSTSPDLLRAITIDLLVTMPLIHFLLIRKTSIPKTTVVPIFVLGLVAASFIIPVEHQGLLSLAKSYVLPLVELSVLTYVSTKVYRAVRLYRDKSDRTIDTYDTIAMTCAEIMPPKIAKLMATELGVIYYLIFSWRAKRDKGYSYHKKNGSVALLGVLSFIIIVEVLVMHILIERWSPVAAWILTGLSIYSLLQVLALIRSIYLRPIKVDSDSLLLRYGLMKKCRIPLSTITSIHHEKRIKISEEDDIENFALLGEMETPNVLIECSTVHLIEGPYSMQRESSKIAVAIDAPEQFVEEVSSYLLRM